MIGCWVLAAVGVIVMFVYLEAWTEVTKIQSLVFFFVLVIRL